MEETDHSRIAKPSVVDLTLKATTRDQTMIGLFTPSTSIQATDLVEAQACPTDNVPREEYLKFEKKVPMSIRLLLQNGMGCKSYIASDARDVDMSASDAGGHSSDIPSDPVQCLRGRLWSRARAAGANAGARPA
eukprot:5259135-Pyramimonas_sp.AAC.1